MYRRINGLRQSGHLTRETFLDKTLHKSRTKTVHDLSLQKAKFYHENASPSFISNEVFGRFEKGIAIPRFKWGTTKVPRLNWFSNYRRNLFRNVFNKDEILEIAEDSDSMISNGKSKSLLINEKNESISDSSIRELFTVQEIAKTGKIYDATILANHFAAIETIKNFGSNCLVDGEVVALCLAEEFGGENSLKFDTVIEDFDDNIVLNGSKSGVIGAKEADYFLVFSSTLVKERDEKLYKRTSTILIPSNTDGVTIEEGAKFSRIHFEDVEISLEMIIGNIGFGKLHLSHLLNVGNIFYSSIISSILENVLTDFISYSQKTGNLADHDSVRVLVADTKIKLWSLDSMIRQVIQKRGFLFDELASEVSAIKVYANSLKKELLKISTIYANSNLQNLDEEIEELLYLSRTFGTDQTHLTSIGFRGISANYSNTAILLNNRQGTSWHNLYGMVSYSYWYKTQQTKFFAVKNPKITQMGNGGGHSLYGTSYLLWENFFNNPITQHREYNSDQNHLFIRLFDLNGKIIADRIMRLIELHGNDINKDEFIASKIGQIGVDHFALAALYSRFKYDESLEQYNDLLVKRVLRLEAEAINILADKFQLTVDHEHRISLESKGVTQKLMDSRSYIISSPLAIENVYTENSKFLSNIEKLKLLDG